MPEEEKPAAPAPAAKPAEEAKAKKKEKRGKKQHKNKPTSQRWKKYKIEGDKITKERNCPRCGPGIFLMKAKDRVYCGRCHYAEFVGKEEKKVEEEKKE